MKSLIQASQGLIIILVFIVLLIMLAYHGSGHKIPLDTDLTFGGTIASLIAVYFILTVLKRRI